jgi:hypothetical protein
LKVDTRVILFFGGDGGEVGLEGDGENFSFVDVW